MIGWEKGQVACCFVFGAAGISNRRRQGTGCWCLPFRSFCENFRCLLDVFSCMCPELSWSPVLYFKGSLFFGSHRQNNELAPLGDFSVFVPHKLLPRGVCGYTWGAPLPAEGQVGLWHSGSSTGTPNWLSCQWQWFLCYILLCWLFRTCSLLTQNKTSY